MQILRAAIYGFAVGDALGVPYEFTPREIMTYQPAVGMSGFGTHQQPPGTWSDDTSFMLCVLENILEDGTPQTLKNKMLKCYRDGYLTPHGNMFDIGRATYLGIHVKNSSTDNNSIQGNGSLMRCLPYAFRHDIRRAFYDMYWDNKITHDNALCHLCCIFYVRLARALIEGSNPEKAMQTAAGFIKLGSRITDLPECNSDLKRLDRLTNPEFSRIPECEIISSGHVLYTLEAACWCLLNTHNYRDAVLKAVNLGGDTDTIAALTGALAAIVYGENSIPKAWLCKLKNKKSIENILDRTKEYDVYLI